MKKLQNTLYIVTPGSYLHCQNETIAIKVNGEEKVRIPGHTVESIVCFGNTTVSTPFIAFCSERKISLSFLSEHGHFYGRIYGPVSGNVLLRKRQFEALSDPGFSISFVRILMYCKIANARNMIQRYRREQEEEKNKAELEKAAKNLVTLAHKLDECESIDSLRGVEGAAASTYFGVFDAMLRGDEPELRFESRSKRPPQNAVNALMSFLYMLLKNDVQAALETVGLDPAAGFLHALRPGRPALALDMMEELRAPLCDRLALTLINRKQLKPEDFLFESNGIKLTDKARKEVLSAWQARKQESIMHQFLQEKIQIGLIPYAQAQLLARVFRGDLDQYPPFLWR